MQSWTGEGVGDGVLGDRGGGGRAGAVLEVWRGASGDGNGNGDKGEQREEGKLHFEGSALD